MDQSPRTLIDRLIHASFAHRAFVVMLVALASVLGLAAYQRMPRNVYPDITIPVFTIVTENEAMAPEEVELLITRPMESAMGGLPGARRVRSQTSQGLSTVVVEFDIETEYWRARQFVTERMTQVVGQLPAGTEPPTLSSATTRLAEVYEYALEGDLPATQLRDVADWQVRSRLLTVPGVGDVLNMGGRIRQYQVTLDPERLRAHDITLAEVEEAIRQAGSNAAGGFISTGPTEYMVRGIGRFNSVSDLEHTILAVRAGVPILLKHVAEAREGTAIRRGMASRNGKEVVTGLVIKQPNADTVQVVRGVEAALAELRNSLPEGMRIVPFYDQTHLIRESLANVAKAILAGAVLVILVLFVFLGQFRNTLIVAASIPLSVFIAGLLMWEMKVGINTMSLGGLAIAVGIMVDASIIMVENIYHRFHRPRGAGSQGDSKALIARRAATEVGRPIAFASLIIIAVFIPLFLMGGIEGLLFQPLALTVMAAMSVSLLLSLTLTPLLASRFVPLGTEAEGEVRVVRWVKRGYHPMLEWVLHRRRLVVGIALALLVPAAAGLFTVGRDFMPRLEEGSWIVATVTLPETSLEENDRITRQVEAALLDEPNVREVVRRIGRPEQAFGCWLLVNSGETNVNLRSKRDRTKPLDAVLADVREKIERIPGVAVAFTQPLQCRIDESLEGTPAPLQVKLFGPDVSILTAKGAAIREVMERTRGVTDVKMDQVSGIPQLCIQIDRQQAAMYGVPEAAILRTIRLVIGGEELSQVWHNQRSYGIFVRFPEQVRGDPEAVGNILVDTASGTQVPLSQVAEVTLAEGPNVIWRESMSRVIRIDASIQGRDLGGVIADLREGLKSLDLPDGYQVVFGGQYQNQQRATRALLLATAIALTVVFVLLFMALGSVSHALMILGTVPSAFVGGVGSLLLAGESLNVSSAVGFVALLGIAVQNSLVLLTQTRGFIGEGHSQEEAIRLASVQRLRPKLMTASCTALGLVPILLSGGVGAEIEKPLAIVMVGGLVTSTLFTLLVLPAVYLLLEQTKRRVRDRLNAFADRNGGGELAAVGSSTEDPDDGGISLG